MTATDGGTDRTEGTASDRDVAALVDRIAAGEDRALARAITILEGEGADRAPLAAALHERATGVPVVGVTGAPGVGKSTLVDRLATACADRGERVAVFAVDPTSPYTGGAVLGDRVRMRDAAADAFVRSLRAPAGDSLAVATADAITAADVAGIDRVFVETVGVGQHEISIVRTADTVVVLVAPTAGDDVQALKAGVLEIGDVFVLNKADLDGADRAAADLREMVAERSPGIGGVPTGPDVADTREAAATGAATLDDATANGDRATTADEGWSPPVVETVASSGEGVPALLDAIADHGASLDRSGERAVRRQARRVDQVRRLTTRRLRQAADAVLADDEIADRLAQDPPATVAADLVTGVARRIHDDRNDRTDVSD